jgi:hypothetical protein
MRFDPAALKTFLATAQLGERSSPRIRKAEVPAWVPAEVVAAMSPGDEHYFR